MFIQKLRTEWLRAMSRPQQAMVDVFYTIIIPALILEKVGAIPFWAFFLSFIPWLAIGIGCVRGGTKHTA